jgi:hypothetical protein
MIQNDKDEDIKSQEIKEDEILSAHESALKDLPVLDMEAVYFDEVSEIQSRYDRIQSESLRRDEEEKMMKITRKWRCRIVIVVLTCFVIGGIIGTVINTSRLEQAEKQSSNTLSPVSVISTASPPPSLSRMPTTSSIPSVAPSCAAQLQLITSKNTSDLKFRSFEISGNGLVSMGEIVTENSSKTEFREFFYNPSTDVITIKSTQLEVAYRLSTYILSYDGEKLVVGATGYNDPSTGFGAAFLVHQRTDGEWRELYSSGAITSGKEAGQIRQVSIDENVSNIAVIAGIDDGAEPFFSARIYTLPIAPEFNLIRKVLSIEVSRESLVALSGNGGILLIYNYQKDEINIFEFEQLSNKWNEGDKILLSNATKIQEMHVSKDGNSALIIPDVDYYKPPYIYRKVGENWTQFPLDIDTKGKTVFHMYGTISGTGDTVSITISWLNETDGTQESGSFLFQKYNPDYVQMDYLRFPLSRFVNKVGSNSLGDLFVVAGGDSVKVLRTVC